MRKIFAALAVLLLTLGAPAQKKAKMPEYAAGAEASVAALGLTLRFPASFGALERRDGRGDDELGAWKGKLGEKTVEVDLERWSRFGRGEPARITERIHDFVKDDEYKGPAFEFVAHELIEGAYGYAPYASLLWGSAVERGTTKDIGHIWYFAGVTPNEGYLLTVSIEPVANASEQASVLEFLRRGVTYSGELRNAEWDEAELEERWKADSALDEKELEDLKVIRTAHYLVMTNSSGGKKFAEQMEINYAIIQKTYPFPEVAGRKLMPVFLFRNPDEYYAFCVKQFQWTLAQARKSKGVASRDFYATWYEAPQDPVHIHEATHQIFGNRLELNGGGSWFQEGVAEYVESKPNELNDIARRVKDGKHTPLRELMRLRSLLMSSQDDRSGDSAAGLHYKQAALLIEFLRDSKFGRPKFDEWMHAMGNTPRGDIPAIEAVFRRIYGVSIDELDAKLQEYCKKR